METRPPRGKKEIQRLTGRLAALSRFISKYSDRLRPFFNILKAGTANWTEECDQALDSIKQYLSEPPILCYPQQGEELYVYLAVSATSISAVLLREDETRAQRPIYYVSKALSGAELRYSLVEQAALALKVAATKLRPYFQAHQISVLTDQPLRATLHKPDLSGRMIKWAIELSQYGIHYKPRLSIKGQILADFITELPQSGSQLTQTACEWWILHVDGASRSSGAGVGIVLVSPKGEKIEQAVRLSFPATNNEAEYEAVLVGLDLALAIQVTKIRIQSDSQLVAAQIKSEYEARDERMITYLSAVKSRLAKMEEWQIVWVLRE